MFLLVEVLLAGVLLFGVLLVAGEEMVLAVSGLLELGSETLREEEALLLSSASLVVWYSWNLFSSVDWTRGIDSRTSGLCRCTGMLIQQRKVYEYKRNRYKNGIGMS